jgi:uncharacterized lipoprotein YbaY
MPHERERTALVVKGDIIFDNNVKSFSGATIYIRLNDVTMQDAPSKLILQQVIKDVNYDDGNHGSSHQKKFKFELFGNIVVDFRLRYAVSVHIDLDNDGKIGLGDLINMESYPVITHGYPKYNISVHVREVK